MRGTWQTTGGGGGDGWLTGAGIVAAAVVLGAASKGAASAGRVLGEVLKAAAITVGCLAGLAVAAVLTVVAVRVRRVLRARRAAAARVLSCPHCQGLPAPQAAIEGHVVSPEDARAALYDEMARIRRP
jgi:hypothetical protein